VERFRIEPLPKEPYPAPNLLLAIRWPSGATSYYAHARQYWDDFLSGRLPLFPKGVYLERIPDNGTRSGKHCRHARLRPGFTAKQAALEPVVGTDQAAVEWLGEESSGNCQTDRTKQP